MYKVFVGTIPIILSTQESMGEEYLSLPIKEANINDLIKKIRKNKLKHLHLYHRKEHKLLKHFKKQVKPIKAGGGLVRNAKGEVLFIYRKEHWDLPKGKVKKEEEIHTAAMREVEEETGVKNLKIIRELPITYHVLKRKGRYRLKITHWYEMQTDYDKELDPQKEEDISLAEWKDYEGTKQALKDSYENIKLLFQKEYFE